MNYELTDKVFGLAPVVIENNKLINYSGIFSNDQGIDLDDFIHELQTNGLIDSKGPHVLDCLAINGDIIQDFPLTEQGLNFLIKEMGVIPSDNPLVTVPLKHLRDLERQGYSNLLVCHGEVWGFLESSVMPVRCPLSDR